MSQERRPIENGLLAAHVRHFALRLAEAEHSLHALTSGQLDAVVDRNGTAYLLHPAQERLRRNEARLQALFESTADVITVVSRGGLILSQSPAMKRVLGYGPGELVGRILFDFVHDDDLPHVYCAFFNVIEEFCAHSMIEFHHRARDGSWRFLEAAIGKVLDLSSAASVVLSLRDRTASNPAPNHATQTE